MQMRRTLALCLFCAAAAAAVSPLAPVVRHAAPRGARALRVRGGSDAARARAPTATEANALLAVMIGLEICGTTCMKLASENAKWHLGTVVGYGACFSIFPIVLRTVPLGVAYAIWSGVGTAATALVGAALFHETLSPAKGGALAIIVLGVVLLELAGDH